MNQQGDSPMNAGKLLQELKETQQELSRLKEEHRMLVGSLDEMLWWVDLTSQTMHMSSACERIFGYTSEEMSKICDIWKTFVLPEDHRTLEQLD